MQADFGSVTSARGVAGLEMTDWLAAVDLLADRYGGRNRLVGGAQAAWVFNGDYVAVHHSTGVADQPGTGGQNGLADVSGEVDASVARAVRALGRMERVSDLGRFQWPPEARRRGGRTSEHRRPPSGGGSRRERQNVRAEQASCEAHGDDHGAHEARVTPGAISVPG